LEIFCNSATFLNVVIYICSYRIYL
jgi:hypothetical protein